ncbi:hypothetical protein NXH76_03590 [Blautia schinkii]|nr:hypothetical protein [Blautia schinkii]
MNMKKILSVVLAGAMVIGMNSFAMAAPSITAALDTNNVKASEGEVTITKEVDTTNLPEEGKKGVEALVKAEKGATLLEAFKAAELDLSTITIQSDLEADGKEIKTEDLKILSPVADLVITGATPTKENPVDVTFTVNNATDDVEIYVLHYCEEHSWELLETEKEENADNQVKAPFHSASPVALVYTEKAADAADAAKSPATE